MQLDQFKSELILACSMKIVQNGRLYVSLFVLTGFFSMHYKTET